MAQYTIDNQHQKAYDKYRLISLNVRESLKIQEKTMKNINDLENKMKELSNAELEKKKLKINLLEYQVFKFKSDSIELV